MDTLREDGILQFHIDDAGRYVLGGSSLSKIDALANGLLFQLRMKRALHSSSLFIGVTEQMETIVFRSYRYPAVKISLDNVGTFTFDARAASARFMAPVAEELYSVIAKEFENVELI